MMILEKDIPFASQLNPGYGSVTLVGAGPGDPELLTIKGMRAIFEATILLVDDLVNPEILQYASPLARIIQVGKRGGCISTPQSYIEKLMISAVAKGEKVVRLKGGDPFIFGRGGEELEHLQALGIPVKVINGITSGLAASTALGAPLTHRDHAVGVLMITGHSKPGREATDWVQIGKVAQDTKLTLVIYMGITGVDAIQSGLMKSMPSETPVAIVQKATLPDQRIEKCSLRGLVSRIREANMGSPSIIVIGDVLQALAQIASDSVAPTLKHIKAA
jgi:uroporphyrin-III C-methyltransferase